MSKKTNKLVAREVRVADLDSHTRDQMWRVFERYYGGTARDAFDADLASKQHVILLRDAGDRSLQGFSTLDVYDREIEGRRVVAIFSGDTIVEKEYWGQRALQTAFFLFILRTKLQHPTTPVYWFLISKGYKTYLLLSRNFEEYWPRHDAETPRWQRTLLDRLARDKFGPLWDSTAGVLRMGGRDGHLKPGVAPIDAADLEHEDIRFFVTMNPNYVAGDELACIGLIDLSFALSYLRKRARRVIRLREDGWASTTAPA